METEWPINPIIVAKWWAKRKKSKFKRWTASEVANEAWIALHKIRHRYDPEKGSFLNWAEANLWDTVNISYCRAFGIKITRPREHKDGVTRAGKRVYEDKWRSITEDMLVFLESKEEQPRTDPEIELKLSPKQRVLCELLARGLNQRQCGFALGVTESAITQMLYTIRKNNAAHAPTSTTL